MLTADMETNQPGEAQPLSMALVAKLPPLRSSVGLG